MLSRQESNSRNTANPQNVLDWVTRFDIFNLNSQRETRYSIKFPSIDNKPTNTAIMKLNLIEISE
jgi:hypothetical protein